MKFSRHWAMPNSDTFSVPPIGEFVLKYLQKSKISVDPFARNKRWATYTNDLNPNTEAEYHLDALDFVNLLAKKEIKCDLAIFDPPYSPRQISECYAGIGRKCTEKDTQDSVLKMNVRKALLSILTPDSIVLTFGWNSVGMGKKNGFEIIEISLVCHGGIHNDTICLAEKRKYIIQESNII
ncbi:MAG: adenine-specific DNA methylase [Nanoarchaeota archaeon]